jgi:uncharacterized protein with HEPN domain
MPRRDLAITLRQMLQYTREAMEMGERVTRDRLGIDIVLTRSLLHTLEMIGEAARRVAEEDRKRYPAIPWQDIVDLRNRLIHGYDRVDYDTVWEIVTGDLPRLATDLERMAESVGNGA